MRRPPSRRQAAVVIAATLGLTCADPQAPEATVETIQLSVLDTGTTMFFREPVTVEATPIGHLGVPVARTVTWESKSPTILSVVPVSEDGRTARISALGVGLGQIQVVAGTQTKTFDVTVLDTVYSVVVTPASANLIAGDTISLTATVDGPATAVTTVRWDSAGSPLKILSSADSNTIRVQAMVTGSATISARATADTTKRAATVFTIEQGTLVFVTQPSTVMKGAPISPVRVAVQDAAGTPSRRTINEITLTTLSGSCSSDATLMGDTKQNPVNGIAVFSDLSLDRLSAACQLTAFTSPAGLSTTSAVFAVTARGCDPVPYAPFSQISGFTETGDCAITRSGETFYTHNYSITVPPDVLDAEMWRVDVNAGFSPRLEAYLWPPATVSRDTAAVGSDVSQYYVLVPGTYTFSVTSSQPGATGSYTLSSLVGRPNLGGLCYRLAAKNFTDGGSSGFGPCTHVLLSLAGPPRPARAYIVYLPAGETGTVLLRMSDPGPDAYLEILDVTTPGSRQLIASDNNSATGGSGKDAIAFIPSAATNRFIEILALELTSASSPSFTLTLR